MVEANPGQEQRIVLLLGEGNFSYALARVRLHLAKHSAIKLRLIATSFDSEEALFKKYPESVQIHAKMRELSTQNEASLHVEIFHDVDATNIASSLPAGFLSAQTTFDEVTFCHPHIGSEDLRRNSALVAHYFSSARSLNPALIQVTLLESQYDRWQLSKVERLNSLRLIKSDIIQQDGEHDYVADHGQPDFVMDRALWAHGYETRRHQSGKSFSTSKVGRNFTIQSAAYIYALDDVDNGPQLTANEVLMCAVAPKQQQIEEEIKEEQFQASGAFVCDICQKTFQSERALANHKQSHGKQGASAVFSCPHCDKTFANAQNLESHIKAKHEQGGAGSISADHKGITLEICEDLNQNKCSVCGQDAHGPEFLQPPVQLSLKCPYCDRTFVNQRALSQHATLSCKKRPQQQEQRAQ